MKLLFFIASIQCGGAERVAATLCSYWAERGFKVTLATFDDGSVPPFFPLSPAVRHLTLDLQTRSTSLVPALVSNVKRVRRLRALVAQERPDAIVSFIDGTNVQAILAAAGTGIPVVVSERVDPAHHTIPRPWRILRRLTYGSARAIVVQTAQAAAYFPARWSKRIAVVPNPVSKAALAEPVGRAPGARRTIVAIGRLDPQKGFDLLIRAFAKIARRRPDWDVTILGDGPERGRLEADVQHEGLSGRVRLPGRESDVGRALRAADLFVLSSRYEGFPNALCEAMANGLPVISFDCPSGPRDIVRDGVDGWLVPPEDVGALAAAMERATGDAALRASFSRRATEISDRFAIASIAARWEALMRSGA